MEECKFSAIYQVLGAIQMEASYYRLADSLASTAEDWGDDGHSLPELEQAAADCLAAGWIKVLTAEDRQEDRLRWANDPHQNWSESFYGVGSVDLTPAGWKHFAVLIWEERGVRLEDRYQENGENVIYIWRIPSQVSVVSSSQEQLLRERTEILAGTDSLYDGSLSQTHTIGDVVGPYAIGPWWVSRFYQAPSGYRLDIPFEPDDIPREPEG